MNCITCGRLIRLTPAVTIPARCGPLHMGQTCAKRAGLVRPANPKTPVHVVRGEIGQIDMFQGAEK